MNYSNCHTFKKKKKKKNLKRDIIPIIKNQDNQK